LNTKERQSMTEEAFNGRLAAVSKLV
jgi:hypothetical protein